MHYDVRNVAYEYEQAEEYLAAGDVENAIKHYQLAIDNYNLADNEEVCSPYTKFPIEVTGKRIKYLSLIAMEGEASWKIEKLSKKATLKQDGQISGWWRRLRKFFQ